MKNILAKHKLSWKDKKFRRSVFLSVILFAATMVISHYTSLYADKVASNYVGDIILDNFKVRDVDGILVYGIIFYALVILGYLIFEPKKFPFAMKSLSFFYFTRAIFITFTHLQTYPVHTQIDQAGFIANFLIGGDSLFFSGHTGVPYLVALIFWDNKFIRNFSLATSVVMGVCVLLGHIHYTIDVVSAFFITYTIYQLCRKFFPADLRVFQES